MPSLYVMEIGSRIEIEYQRVLVTLDDEVLLRLPIHKVDQIILIGRVGVTTPALHKLLELNIPLIFLNSGGKYIGQVAPALSRNLPLRQQQYRQNDDPDFTISFAKSVVAGKIHNQVVQARRWARYVPEITTDMIESIKKYEEASQQVQEMSSLLGIEGNASKRYFGIMQMVVAPEWGFIDRNRRPPKDPVNALLSLGYTLLTYVMCSALQIVGLDPYLGYYHVEGYGRPSLALDLIEEFRIPIVDNLVTGLINRGQIQKRNFITTEEGVCMDALVKRTFITAFGHKMAQNVKTLEINRGITYQKHMEVQALKTARYVQRNINTYKPFLMR